MVTLLAFWRDKYILLFRDFTRCNVETVKIASLLTSMINIQPAVNYESHSSILSLSSFLSLPHSPFLSLSHLHVETVTIVSLLTSMINIQSAVNYASYSSILSLSLSLSSPFSFPLCLSVCRSLFLFLSLSLFLTHLYRNTLNYESYCTEHMYIHHLDLKSLKQRNYAN